MNKFKPRQPDREEKSMFTKPEIEAAMQLIQLSGDSNVDVQSYDVSNSLCQVFTTDTKIKEVVCDDDVDESQGSCTSDMTSVTKSVRPYFLDEDEVVGRKRKRKRTYEILTQILGKPTDEATSSDPSPSTAEWLKIDSINFNDNKRTRSIALKAELHSLKLGDLTIDAYFHKIKTIATIMTSLSSPINNDGVFTIALEGFPDKYDNVSCNTPNRVAAE
ncbi:hypothetical protein Tco_1432400 [Tanacetum coccineum]